jgi:hypothetical protein
MRQQRSTCISFCWRLLNCASKSLYKLLRLTFVSIEFVDMYEKVPQMDYFI